jgi:hypothetical protein
MSACISLRRIDILFVTVGTALFSGVLSPSAYTGWPQEGQTSQSQQQSSEPQQNPQSPPPPQDTSAPKPKKVWTNDDVISLRSPAEVYQAEKEAQAASDAEAAKKKAELAKRVKEAGMTMKLPATPEETQTLIKDKQEQIRNLQDAVDRLNHDLPDAPEEQKVKIQKQIEAFTGDSQAAQLELKVLEDHLQNLAKIKPVASPTPPPASSTPENR